MTPERLLWQHVVLRAVLDATNNMDVANDYERRARKDALKWMEGDSQDFFEVCTMAGLDPYFIRERFKAGLDMEMLKSTKMVTHRLRVVE